jgi:hypothetical protein
VSETEKPSSEENRRPPSGPVSSPRAYFGRASRAATRALRAGITEVPEPGSSVMPKRPPVYHAGDPALRLFAGFTLPLPPAAPLTGAVATLTGIRDGAHEKLFIDLGTSLVRSTPRRDEKEGSLSLVLSRTQSAETYATLLASLRYVNDAAEPTTGARQVALQMIDGRGRARDVALSVFGVGEAPPETGTTIVAEDERVIIGEKLSFNSDGDFTLFWWPNLLQSAAARADRARRAKAAEPDPEAAAGSYFSAGGRLYRVFDEERERPAPPTPAVAAPPPAYALAAPATAANDSRPPAPRAANDSVWVPGRGAPPPGFERARMLRLEDIFGSDMQDAISRRLIEQRIAAGG